MLTTQINVIETIVDGEIADVVQEFCFCINDKINEGRFSTEINRQLALGRAATANLGTFRKD